jgi:hypothetical protein
MEEVDDFPFADLEEFEIAVERYLFPEKEHALAETERFAYAPPISVFNGSVPLTLESPRFHEEQEKRRSPHARNQSFSKECLDEVARVEARLEEKIEHLQNLYFYLADKLKQLENKVNK